LEEAVEEFNQFLADEFNLDSSRALDLAPRDANRFQAAQIEQNQDGTSG
jgi:hypothetical protein